MQTTDQAPEANTNLCVRYDESDLWEIFSGVIPVVELEWGSRTRELLRWAWVLLEVLTSACGLWRFGMVLLGSRWCTAPLSYKERLGRKKCSLDFGWRNEGALESVHSFTSARWRDHALLLLVRRLRDLVREVVVVRRLYSLASRRCGNTLILCVGWLWLAVHKIFMGLRMLRRYN